jgi:serine/threonine-protein kinase
VHRDLKPANLFCTRDEEGMPCIKVLDFGASRLLAPLGTDSDLSLSRVGVPIGSPLYMAPEQIHATDSVDVRADIWALGAIVYELVTGRTPFTGTAITDLIMKIVMTEPTRPSELQPALPQRFEAILLRCLEKDPLLRFRNVGELALELAEFAPRRAQASVDRITRRVASEHTLGVTSEEAPLYTSAPLTPPPRSAQPGSRGSAPPVARTQPMPSSHPPVATTQAMPSSRPPLAATQVMPSIAPPAQRRPWQRDVALALLIAGGMLAFLLALGAGLLYLLGVFG